MKTKILLIWLVFSTCFFAQSKNNNCTGVKVDKFTIIEAPSIFRERNILNKTATSNFEVIESDTHGLTVGVRNALEHAIEIWSFLLNTDTSSQTIKIFVEYKDLDSAVTLAYCGPQSFYNSDDLPNSDRNYPIALAEYLLGQNLNGNNADINLTINSNMGIIFYTGIDGIPQSGEFDLVSTLLHELAHGFGFAGTMRISGSNGYWGIDSVQSNLTGHFSDMYDYYCSIGSSYPGSDKLINYQSGTTNLASKLKSNNIYFSGPNTRLVNNSYYPKLYAPTTWKGGSSISHLDDATFDNTNNSLMTNATNTAEVIHSPGVVGLTILEDIGWNVNRLATIDAPISGEILTKGSMYTIKWSDNGYTPIQMNLYKIIGDNQLDFMELITYPSGTGSEEYEWYVPNYLDDGEYRIILETGDIAYEISPKFQISTLEMVSLPIITPISGVYSDNLPVSITCSTDSTKIYYTTNGNVPVADTLYSTLYDSAFSVNPPVIVKAIAVSIKSEMPQMPQSNVALADYKLGAVSIVQLDKDENIFGHIDIWSDFSDWVPLSTDSYLKPSGKYFRADTTFKTNTTQKFKLTYEDYYGIDEATFVNHCQPQSVNSTKQIVAKFDEAKNISLRINAENSVITTSNTDFEMEDPWFRDYSDGLKGIRNRGIDAIWSTIPSDVTTSTDHMGVFLGQNPTFDSQLPIYSIKTITPQTVNVQGKNREFYFQKWESDGATF